MKVKEFSFEKKGDEKGWLVCVEGSSDIPFEIKRMFYIYGTQNGAVRGRHANKKSSFVLINVSGKSKVKVDEGDGNSIIYTLDRQNKGLYIPKMVWKEMYDFSPDSVMIILSDCAYDKSEYIYDYEEYLSEVKNG